RALLLDLDDWVRAAAKPPASRYPTLTKGELVPRASVHFPKIPSLSFPDYMPSVWTMDYGAGAERYLSKQDYLDCVERASGDLVTQRFMLAGDVEAAVRRASAMWDAIVAAGSR